MGDGECPRAGQRQRSRSKTTHTCRDPDVPQHEGEKRARAREMRCERLRAARTCTRTLRARCCEAVRGRQITAILERVPHAAARCSRASAAIAAAAFDLRRPASPPPLSWRARASLVNQIYYYYMQPVLIAGVVCVAVLERRRTLRAAAPPLSPRARVASDTRLRRRRRNCSSCVVLCVCASHTNENERERCSKLMREPRRILHTPRKRCAAAAAALSRA